MDPAILVAIILGGVLLLGGSITIFVFAAVSKSRARVMAGLQTEGIVLDSGSAHTSTSFSGFRGPRVAISAGSRSGPGRIVLTQQQLRILSLPHVKYGVGSIRRDAFGALQVRADGGRLRIRIENYPGTSGVVEVTTSVSDVNAWMSALTQAGARA
jgi:hypothetical protein